MSFWRDRPVLVTGGTGLLGGWLIRRLLDARASVVCLVRDWIPDAEAIRSGMIDRCNVVRGDLADAALLERLLGEYEIDTVFHLAAQAIVPIANRNAVSTFESNVRGTWALMEACRRSPLVRQVVVASSDKAYGESDRLPYTEETPLRPVHPYDVSKACADLIVRSWAETWGVPAAITRCGNLYGGGDLNWSRIVPGTIRSLLRGERPVIRSDGKFVRDYFYVEDAAAAYMLLAERLAEDRSLAGQALNFSNETPLTVLDLVERIRAAVGVTIEPEVRNEASGEIRAQYLDASRARALLGWQPLYTLDDGLVRTVDWYRRFAGVSP